MAGIYRRGKTWWGRAQRKGREHRRSLGTQNKAQAESRFREWLTDLDSLAWGDKPARTFQDATDRFIERHLPTLKQTAATRYGVSLINLARTFQGIALHEIGTALLSDFENTRRKEGVKPATIRRDLACLSSLMSDAIEWEWIDANPVPAYMRRGRRRGLREAEPRRRYLSLDEETRLLDAATPAPRQAMQFAIDTGLRATEQFTLTWKQIDVDAGFIRLGSDTKGNRSREVPILPRSAQILAHLKRHPSSPYVWHHEDGTRYKRLNKALEGAARRAGIKDLRWHDLRRTCGCRLLQDYDLSIAKVALILGHHSVTVTEKTYAFLRSEDLAKGLSSRTIVGTGTTDYED